jgi:hypothetical protein
MHGADPWPAARAEVIRREMRMIVVPRCDAGTHV